MTTNQTPDPAKRKRVELSPDDALLVRDAIRLVRDHCPHAGCIMCNKLIVIDDRITEKAI